MKSQELSKAENGTGLRDLYFQLLREKPEIRARDAAQTLGVSEGQLLASRVGDGVTRLVDDPESILKSAASLGEAMALTRNDSCVHERKGVYDNHEFFSHGNTPMGLFVNPDIDLRLFMGYWKYSFAVSEGDRKSVQFFDGEGVAVHKIYLTPKSDAAAYGELVETHRRGKQDAFIETEQYKPEPEDRPDSEIDWKGFRTAWENLNDTHDFFPMLKKFRVGREQALRGIGTDFAYRVANNSARLILELSAEKGCEIMVFVGNRGCLQIHTGPVKKLVERDSWFNVLDPKFNLHLREDAIAGSWITKKPTEDGTVTALEIFDGSSGLIATFFGKRKPGNPELLQWRDIVSLIPAVKEGGGD